MKWWTNRSQPAKVKAQRGHKWIDYQEDHGQMGKYGAYAIGWPIITKEGYWPHFILITTHLIILRPDSRENGANNGLPHLPIPHNSSRPKQVSLWAFSLSAPLSLPLSIASPFIARPLSRKSLIFLFGALTLGKACGTTACTKEDGNISPRRVQKRARNLK